MLPSISNDFAYTTEVTKAYFTFSCTLKHNFVIKLGLIHSAELTIIEDKGTVLSLFVCFCYIFV